MAQRRGIRAAVVDTGFAAADRLDRIGLGGVTWRTRRALARFGFDDYAIDVDGLALGGSLADHGTYLRMTERFGTHPFQQQVFEDAVGEGATVLDCGAYIGLYTLVAARRAGPGGHGHRGRAGPAERAAPCAANVSANGYSDRVEIVEAAAADAARPRAPSHALGARPDRIRAGRRWT